jgi:DinB family protein
MTSVVSHDPVVKPARPVSRRATLLADRLEQGARLLDYFASSLTEEEWRIRVPKDGRTIGVVVHHVASVYPVEIHLANTLAAGNPVTGVTPADIDAMNARHAEDHADVGKEETLELLRRNSAAAAEAIRLLSDAELDRAAPASYYSDAPITCQFMLEDHAVRHSYHHLAKVRAALQQQ